MFVWLLDRPAVLETAALEHRWLACWVCRDGCLRVLLGRLNNRGKRQLLCLAGGGVVLPSSHFFSLFHTLTQTHSNTNNMCRPPENVWLASNLVCAYAVEQLSSCGITNTRSDVHLI